ncbi:DNA-binding transcriptional regulator, AcrR family [Parafrankia irregularis]|uniref:DNA-binding transcriptional regulator, AcrR family n=1 Tax=Parafrankia irregularis TaxID=795642 RepID=A0A0S4QI71_9ACTN|nr:MULTISPECIES: TetR/AcrR family transcriptional regulator [Parafrankia]MBE3204194.1 TetR/AcrR family transcriptional regulator [Parafrankia sp. CH37]CUU54926.1 DNA-binding transcriptional regulator, AcrR family [Parafrankia irregularis]
MTAPPNLPLPPNLPPRGVERALARQRHRYEDEVERLIDATFRVMRERDTANPSVSEILAASGLSTTAFYRHFPTKDDLLLTLLERAHDITRRHIEERLAAESDPVQRIAEWVRAMFDLLRTDDLVVANRPFLLAHPRLLERFPAELGTWFDALVAPLATAIADARRAAPGAPAPPAATMPSATTPAATTPSAAPTRPDVPGSDAAVDARLAMQHVFGILVDHAALRRRLEAQTVDSVISYTWRAVLAAGPATPSS